MTSSIDPARYAMYLNNFWEQYFSIAALTLCFWLVGSFFGGEKNHNTTFLLQISQSVKFLDRIP